MNAVLFWQKDLNLETKFLSRSQFKLKISRDRLIMNLDQGKPTAKRIMPTK
jgi:hypothetical protein